MRIYLDTNIFIEAIEGRGTLADLVVSLFRVSRAGGRALFATSELSLAELLVKPLELRRSDLADTYRNWVVDSDFLDVLPVSREILQQAAHLRAADKALKLPDAIHVAAAQRAGCTHFLSRDKRLSDLPDLAVVLANEDNVRRLLMQLKS